MKRKIVWLIVSSLMVLSLLVAACAPKVEEKAPAAPVAPAAPAVKEAAPAAPAAPAKEMVKLTLTKLDGTKIEKMVEKPRYGGTLRFFTTLMRGGFDLFLNTTANTIAGRFYYNTLLSGDWTRSSAGTGETTFTLAGYLPPAFHVGELVESWEIPNETTAIYHLRKGIKFQNKPPYGSWSGREMTADDVVFSIKRAYASKGTTAYAALDPVYHPVSVEATDKYTVVVKSAPGFHILNVHLIFPTAVGVMPRDFYEKYKDMSDWRNVQGTGPFLVVDYVPQSVLVAERNPDYFGKDPLFPENQLPYVDKVEWFIIVDKSTYIAALRTGKVDVFNDGLTAIDDLEALLKTRPDMKWVLKKRVTGSPMHINLTINNPDGTPKPGWVFNDIRVRRALSMAIDRETITKEFFEGYADYLSYPVPDIAEWRALGLYIPLEQQPASVQETLSYNPAKAKQFLAEAGYPKGFKTSVDTQVEWVDVMSIVKEYWAAIGVDLTIKVRESAVFESMVSARSFEHMSYGNASGLSNPLKFQSTSWPPSRFNPGNINDSYINEIALKIWALVDDEAAQIKLYKEKVYSYILEQVYTIVMPVSNTFPTRQPWLRNNDAGESVIGANKFNNWPIYAWLDQELKKKMGY